MYKFEYPYPDWWMTEKDALLSLIKDEGKCMDVDCSFCPVIEETEKKGCSSTNVRKQAERKYEKLYSFKAIIEKLL